MISCGDMWFETIKETQDTQYVDARSRTMALVGTQDERRPGLVGGRRSLPSMFTTDSATWMRIATGYDYVNDLYTWYLECSGMITMISSGLESKGWRN